MSDILLQPYIVSIRKKHSRKISEGFPFDKISIDNVEYDAFTLISDALTGKRNYQIEGSSKHVWHIGKTLIKERVFSRLIYSGEYGYSADIVDAENGSVAHRKTLSQAEQYPYYFLVFLPKNLNRGIIIISKRGQRSVSRLFCDKICELIENAIDGVICDIETYTDATLFKKDIADKKLRTIRYYLRNISSDAFDKREDDLIEKSGEIILEFKVKRGKWYEKIASNLLAAINGGNELLDVISLPREYEYTRVKTVVERAGRSITYDLSDYKNATAKIDISSNIIVNESTGHPPFVSYDEIAKFHLKYLAESIHIVEQ